MSTPASVAELTGLLQEELNQLSRQDDDLKKLVRGFSILLRALRENASGHADLTSTIAPDGSVPPAATPKNCANFSETNRPESFSNERLLRACRIALMETDQAASVEEIRSRILRRGSFAVNDLPRATEAIIGALEAMSREGEAISLSDTPTRSWRRIDAKAPA